jgi:hypothetical protein
MRSLAYSAGSRSAPSAVCDLSGVVANLDVVPGLSRLLGICQQPGRDVLVDVSLTAVLTDLGRHSPDDDNRWPTLQRHGRQALTGLALLADNTLHLGPLVIRSGPQCEGSRGSTTDGCRVRSSRRLTETLKNRRSMAGRRVDLRWPLDPVVWARDAVPEIPDTLPLLRVPAQWTGSMGLRPFAAYSLLLISWMMEVLKKVYFIPGY